MFAADRREYGYVRACVNSGQSEIPCARRRVPDSGRVISRPEVRTQMLQLAADYDRKAVQAEAFAIADGDSLPRHA